LISSSFSLVFWSAIINPWHPNAIPPCSHHLYQKNHLPQRCYKHLSCEDKNWSNFSMNKTDVVWGSQIVVDVP
jgi:hypothetical protein